MNTLHSQDCRLSVLFLGRCDVIYFHCIYVAANSRPGQFNSALYKVQHNESGEQTCCHFCECTLWSEFKCHKTVCLHYVTEQTLKAGITQQAVISESTQKLSNASKNKEGCSLELECFQSRKLQIPVTVSAFYEVNTLHIHFILTSAPSCYCHSFLRRCIFKPSIMQVWAFCY